MKFRDIPVTRKVTVAILLVFGAALLLAASGVFLVSSIAFRQRAASQIKLLADLVAVGVDSDVLFNSSDDAVSVLKRLRREPEIVAAHVFRIGTNDTRIILASSSTNAPKPSEDALAKGGIQRVPDGIWLIHDLKDDNGNVFGTFAALSDLSSLRREQTRSMITLLSIFAAMLALSLWLAALLKRSITEPISILAATVHRISQQPDPKIRIRAPNLGRDEVGALADDFNRMLDTLDAQATALIDKEERYRLLVENSSELVCEVRLDGSLVYANPNFKTILGFDSAELVHNNFLAGVHPEDLHEVTARLGRMETQAVFRYRHKDGSWRWLEAAGRRFRTSATEEHGVLIARDITERKQTQTEVQQLKNYLANIINSMPSILVGTDLEQKVTQWNRQAEITTGIPAANAIGQPIEAMLPDFHPWIEPLRGEIQLLRPASREKLLLIKGGERQFFDLMLYPLVANGIQGAVLRIENVTEQVRIQELMIQTEKMLSVGGLAAGMAHEINNPLGIITQAAQNVERRILSDLPGNRRAAEASGVSLEGLHAYFQNREIPAFIHDIREAASRAGKIVSNMLQFSRKSESGKQPAPLAEVLDRSMEMAANDYDLKKKYDFRNIEIVRDYHPSLPTVAVMAIEMEQVFLNLIKNAAQAMAANPPERKPRIVLRLKQEEGYAIIEVEDNGPGMDEKTRLRVFEPFFTTKEPGVGTGLGLSVSYMIVTQNHKGVIDVESAPGHGAVFRIKLPVLPEDSKP